MKQLFFMLLLGCFPCNQSTKAPKQGIKNIIEETPMIRLFPSSEKINHLYDMCVVHSSFVKNGEKRQLYLLKAYSGNNSDVRFGVINNEIYNKVKYIWVNDSVLKFKLFNTNNKLSTTTTLETFSDKYMSFHYDSISDVQWDSIPSLK